MSSIRIWILLLAATSFLAGGAAGLLLGTRLRIPERERRPFDAYEESLVRAHDLSPEKRRWLRAILDLYHQNLEDLRARHMEGLEPELVELGLACRQQVRDYVLPETERGAFDAASALSSPAHPDHP